MKEKTLPYEKYIIKTKPSLRDKKRYVVYEIISETKIDQQAIKQEIQKTYKRLFGEIDFVIANIRFFSKYSTENKGIIEVERNHLEKLKVVFGWIKEIKNKKIIIRSALVSGTIKKCKMFISSEAQ